MPFTDVIVKSSNVGAIKVGLQRRRRAARASTSAASASARRVVARLPRRERRHRLEPGEAGPTARSRRCRWAIRSASRRCRWSTAVSSVANGGELLEPRVVRAVHQRRPPRSTCRTRCCAGRSAPRPPPTLTTIMEAVVERGTAKRGADSGLHDRRQDRHRREAGQRPLLEVGLQRVVRRLRAVAQAGADDRRRHRFAARRRLHRRRGVGAGLQADRRSGAALSRRRPDAQPAAAGARRATRSAGRADVTPSAADVPSRDRRRARRGSPA